MALEIPHLDPVYNAQQAGSSLPPATPKGLHRSLQLSRQAQHLFSAGHTWQSIEMAAEGLGLWPFRTPRGAACYKEGGRPTANTENAPVSGKMVREELANLLLFWLLEAERHDEGGSTGSSGGGSGSSGGSSAGGSSGGSRPPKQQQQHKEMSPGEILEDFVERCVDYDVRKAAQLLLVYGRLSLAVHGGLVRGSIEPVLETIALQATQPKLGSSDVCAICSAGASPALATAADGALFALLKPALAVKVLLADGAAALPALHGSGRAAAVVLPLLPSFAAEDLSQLVVYALSWWAVEGDASAAVAEAEERCDGDDVAAAAAAEKADSVATCCFKIVLEALLLLVARGASNPSALWRRLVWLGNVPERSEAYLAAAKQEGVRAAAGAATASATRPDGGLHPREATTELSSCPARSLLRVVETQLAAATHTAAPTAAAAAQPQRASAGVSFPAASTSAQTGNDYSGQNYSPGPSAKSPTSQRIGAPPAAAAAAAAAADTTLSAEAAQLVALHVAAAVELPEGAVLLILRAADYGNFAVAATLLDRRNRRQAFRVRLRGVTAFLLGGGGGGSEIGVDSVVGGVWNAESWNESAQSEGDDAEREWMWRRLVWLMEEDLQEQQDASAASLAHVLAEMFCVWHFFGFSTLALERSLAPKLSNPAVSDALAALCLPTRRAGNAAAIGTASFATSAAELPLPAGGTASLLSTALRKVTEAQREVAQNVGFSSKFLFLLAQQRIKSNGNVGSNSVAAVAALQMADGPGPSVQQAQRTRTAAFPAGKTSAQHREEGVVCFTCGHSLPEQMVAEALRAPEAVVGLQLTPWAAALLQAEYSRAQHRIYAACPACAKAFLKDAAIRYTHHTNM